MYFLCHTLVPYGILPTEVSKELISALQALSMLWWRAAAGGDTVPSLIGSTGQQLWLHTYCTYTCKCRYAVRNQESVLNCSLYLPLNHKIKEWFTFRGVAGTGTALKQRVWSCDERVCFFSPFYITNAVKTKKKNMHGHIPACWTHHRSPTARRGWLCATPTPPTSPQTASVETW